MVKSISLRAGGVAVVLFCLCVCLTVGQECCQPGQKLTRKSPFNCVTTANASVPNPITCDMSVEELQFITSNQLDMVIDEDNNLVLGNINNSVTITKDKFCVFKQKQPIVKIRAALVCSNRDEEPLVDSDAKAYCMLTSAVFLLITAIVYASLPELRDLQGKCIASTCASLAMGLIMMSTLHLEQILGNFAICQARGFLTYFFIVSSFLWMNTISIQVLVGIRSPSMPSYGWKPFLKYSAYVWSVTVGLTAIVAIVQYHPGNHIKPGFGVNHCWFIDSTQLWIYFYSVLSLVLIVNIGIYVYASVHLWRSSFKSSNIKVLRYKFVLMLRLFVVMGIPWLFEMVSSLTGQHIIWAIIDTINTLHGVIIFILLVVLRKRALKALHRHGWLPCCRGYLERHFSKAVDEEGEDILHTTVVQMEDKS